LLYSRALNQRRYFPTGSGEIPQQFLAANQKVSNIEQTSRFRKGKVVTCHSSFPKRYDMISSGLQANYRHIKGGGSQNELSRQVGDTVRELHQLLELYAPVWYTEELHDSVEAALHVLGKVSAATQVRAANGKRDLKPSSA
jgi:hypothetical protein